MPQSSGAGNAAFAQQGTVDWTALSRSSFTFSVEVMSRFSKAGVEMITCAMGQALCSQFNVPPEGQQRVTDAISKLKAYSSYGQVLWFGFGVKHIVRSLCETKQGATCAALCACLRVSYSTEMSARVLSVLCDQLLLSDGLSPAIAQWGALIDVCSGALSPSKFPNTVDGFCRLAFTDRQRHSQYHKATTADALARALAELSKVSNGSVSSITFEGGYDCGWIAAVAEWLLCLKVKVLTEKGSCIYWPDNSHTIGSAQVIIIFKTHTHDPDIAETKELKIVNRSFHLPDKGISTLLQRSGDHGEVFAMGRSSWSTILEDTFGSAFKMLLSSNTIGFAKFLLLGTTTRSDTLGGISHYHCIHPAHPWMGPFSSRVTSQVRAFFPALASRLPELSPLLDAVEDLERSAGVAAGSDESPLWEYCHCNRSGSTSQQDICLEHLGKTLIHLILILAHIDVDETLQPASTGLLMLYERVVRKDTGMSELFPRRADDIDNTYRIIFELFTGLPSHNSVHKLGAASAISHGGICIWLPALDDPLYDPTVQMGFRLISGMINFRGRLYKTIVDMGEDDLSCRVNPIMPMTAAHGTTRGSTVVVRETLDASLLEAWIELPFSKTLSALNTCFFNLGVARPRQLPSALRLHIRELIDNLRTTIDNSTCAVNLGHARCQGLPKPDLTTWERPCPNLALTLRPTAPPSRSYNYPEVGEWVLIVTKVTYEAQVVVFDLFRGDLTLLYYFKSLLPLETATFMSCFDGCIRCLASIIATSELNRREEMGRGIPLDPSTSELCWGCRFKYSIEKKKDDELCLIYIHTITENEFRSWSAEMTGSDFRAGLKHTTACLLRGTRNFSTQLTE